jgi:uncharacterized protein (TIRG00374 family)
VRRSLFRILKVVVSLGLLTYLVHRAGVAEIAAVFRSADTAGLALALAVYLSTVVLISWRWRILLSSQDVSIPFGRLLRLYFIGFFFNNFLPTSIGGDIYRVLGAGRTGGRRATVAASVLVERLMGMLAVSVLAILAAVVVVRQLADGGVRGLTLGFGVVMIVLMAVFFHPRTFGLMENLIRRIHLWGLEDKLLRLHDALDLYKRNGSALVMVFLLSLAYQLLIVLFSFLVGRALGLAIPLRYFLLCVPFTVIISLVPISINGLGVRESGYVFLLAKIGFSSSQAVSLSLLIYGLSLLASVAGGVAYIFQSDRARTVRRSAAGDLPFNASRPDTAAPPDRRRTDA